MTRGVRANLVGCRFGTIEVLEEFDCTRKQGMRWLCRCDCGNVLIRNTGSLRRGKHTSCHACNSARMSKQFTVHGESNIKDRSALYKTWLSMRERCNNQAHPFFHCYGGKGVTVCPDWDDYGNFKAWAVANGYEHRPDIPLGDRPSLDRKDPSGPYSPENCRIIRHRDNARRHKFVEESSSVH